VARFSAGLVQELGPSIKAGTVAEAASNDTVLVRFAGSTRDGLAGLPDWNGRIVIDGTNPVSFLDPTPPTRRDPSNPLAAYASRRSILGATLEPSVPRFSFQERKLSRLQPSRRERPFRADSVRRPACTILFERLTTAAKTEVRKIIEQTGYFPSISAGLTSGAVGRAAVRVLAATTFMKSDGGR